MAFTKTKPVPVADGGADSSTRELSFLLFKQTDNIGLRIKIPIFDTYIIYNIEK